MTFYRLRPGQKIEITVGIDEQTGSYWIDARSDDYRIRREVTRLSLQSSIVSNTTIERHISEMLGELQDASREEEGV